MPETSVNCTYANSKSEEFANSSCENFFSIIIPVYKAEAYLRQCLDSIQGQSYSNFEAILVDDGSPDGCGKICDEYAQSDKRFHVIHQENAGVCVARKSGIRQAVGEYVCWVDADDYVGVDFLGNLKKIIDANSPDVVAFGYHRVTQSGMPVSTALNAMECDKLYSTDAPEFYRSMIRDNRKRFSNCGALIHGLWSKAIKCEILTDCMLAVPDTLQFGEDLSAVMLALCKSKTVYVSSLCDYYYRTNPTSLTNTIKKEDFKKECVLFQFLSEHIDKVPHENIDAYAFNRIFKNFTETVKDFGSYEEYYRFSAQELTPDVCTIINRTKIPKCTLKEHILYFLLKHYSFRGFWLIYHVRKKLLAKLKNILPYAHKH